MRKIVAFAFLLCAVSMPAQTRPAITGIAFMRVYTDDVAAAEKFYGQTMGYEEKHIDEVMVFPINAHQWIEVVPSKVRDGESYMAAVGFTVSDVEAMRRYLIAKGVAGVESPTPGVVRVADPEGNLVYFEARDTQARAAAIARQTPLSARAPSHHMIHVGMIVHDRAKEDAFWKGVLGFRPYWWGTMHPGNVDWVSLQVPDGTDWLEYMMMPGQPKDQRGFGMSDHFSLGVEHMQTVLHDLQRNGCTEKMCTAIQAGLDGKVQLNLFDSDQTRVEYMEFAPVMEPCCSKFTGPHPKPEE
jgi:catechol 2,3-dioxygenase-like lactoylglutathione lyase family enzyme